jgi:hypothetical protein
MAGFALARGLKASSGRRYENRYADTYTPSTPSRGYGQAWTDGGPADPTPSVVSAPAGDRLDAGPQG